MKKYYAIITILFLVTLTCNIQSQGLSVDAGADIVSGYVWRGLNINNSPNIQPSMSIAVGGFSAGIWGSYSLTANNSSDDNYTFSQEIDFWAGYSLELENGMNIGLMVTDYYFPVVGIKFGNFNNYDDPEGPGAHTIEAGLSVSGPESFPLTFSGFMNLHNDAGNNTYFQIDYSTSLNEVDLGFSIGATGGSEENAAYYGAESFEIINLGINVSKEIKITEHFALPVSAAFILNPNTEVSYLVFGISL